MVLCVTGVFYDSWPQVCTSPFPILSLLVQISMMNKELHSCIMMNFIINSPLVFNIFVLDIFRAVTNSLIISTKMLLKNNTKICLQQFESCTKELYSLHNELQSSTYHDMVLMKVPLLPRASVINFRILSRLPWQLKLSVVWWSSTVMLFLLLSYLNKWKLWFEFNNS